MSDLENVARSRMVDSLRKLADFLESHPAFPLPYMDRVDIFVNDKESLAAAARAFPKAEKVLNDRFFEIHGQIGDISVEVNMRRELACEKRVIGKKEVPEQVLPAREMEVIPAHTEEIFEWVCPESLLEAK